MEFGFLFPKQKDTKMPILPIGDSNSNRQTGFSRKTQQKKSGAGFSIAGKITKALLEAINSGKDRGHTHDR